MNKLLADFRTAMLGVAGAIFTFGVFLLFDRIDSYYTYLSHVSEEGYENYSGVRELWWIPGIFWHILLFIVASFVTHRYVADRCPSPFLLWQATGVLTLTGWLLTLSTATGLECLMQGSMYPLERAADMFLTWFAAKFVAAIFASNVVYSSLIHSVAYQYPILPPKLDEALQRHAPDRRHESSHASVNRSGRRVMPGVRRNKTFAPLSEAGMKRCMLAAALVIWLGAPCAAQQGPAGGDEAEGAVAGFDCPSGELNPNRPEAKLFLGDVTKKARVLPRPAYPRQARAARISGVIRAEVVIDIHSGKVVWAKVGDGHPLLREAVKKAVCGVQFYPTIINSPPFRASGVITYRFGKRQRVPPDINFEVQH